MDLNVYWSEGICFYAIVIFSLYLYLFYIYLFTFLLSQWVCHVLNMLLFKGKCLHKASNNWLLLGATPVNSKSHVRCLFAKLIAKIATDIIQIRILSEVESASFCLQRRKNESKV